MVALSNAKDSILTFVTLKKSVRTEEMGKEDYFIC